MAWSNAATSRNMDHMSVTCEVFHELMSRLNEVARMNMYPMSVTCEVSHAEMSALN